VQIISVVAMPSSACSQCCSTNQDSPDLFSEILGEEKGKGIRPERRFQPVLVGEPSVEDTISIL
jgi:hypothetical protein